MKKTGPLLAVVAFAAFSCAFSALAQTTWILVGFAPGGHTDFLGRLFQDKLAEGTGRPVIVENRVGGGGRIAIKASGFKTSAGM